jgi:hypothetical protein
MAISATLRSDRDAFILRGQPVIMAHLGELETAKGA